jgi:hypothetical protein
MQQEQKTPQYLLVLAYKGRTADISWFDNEADALAAFHENACNTSYIPGMPDATGRHLSLWEFTGRKFSMIKE